MGTGVLEVDCTRLGSYFYVRNHCKICFSRACQSYLRLVEPNPVLEEEAENLIDG